MNSPAQLLRFWRQHKVITLPELIQRLDLSVRSVRRRLKEWKSLSSFNQNGRFYTLPDIPAFDEQGLWFHQNIGFSRHGHLPQTLVALVRASPAGLTAGQLGDCLHLDPRSFLWQFHQYPGLQSQKRQGRYVYFSADPTVAARQLAHQPAAVPAVELPSPAEAIAILVQAIQYPGRSPKQISAAVRSKHPRVTLEAVLALFAHHGLTLKKTPPATG